MRGFIYPLARSRQIYGFDGFAVYGKCNTCETVYKSDGKSKWLADDGTSTVVCPNCHTVNVYKCLLVKYFAPEGQSTQPWCYAAEVVAQTTEEARWLFTSLFPENEKHYTRDNPIDITVKHRGVLRKDYAHCGVRVKIRVWD
jgi:hypothetical protein